MSSSSGSLTEDETAPVGATASEPAARPAPIRGPGETIGARYVVIEELGVGGMGRVLRAYDHKLRREVALKQLRTEALGPDGEARLLREARAMAQLSHPNVVAVYDVDVEGVSVTIAMELVLGQTAKTWLDAQSRDVAAILAVFGRAGRGIAAAHRVGLVHRDFKPHNVLIGREGDVKVTDFGLAKPVGDSRSSLSISSEQAAATAGEDLSDLTAAGTVMGTPRYMAPEQHLGRPTTTASDQYAFCVTLWEALTGASPFSGPGLGAAKLRGPPAWPRGRGRVPARLVTVLERGLAVDPTDRWPSMDALLDALGDDARKRRRRWTLAAAAVAAVTLGGGAIAVRERLAEREGRCRGAPAHLAAIWGEPQRARVGSAILGTEVPFADAAWTGVAASLDGYAQGWIAGHTEACEATNLRGEQSAAMMDLRMACLDRAKGAFAEAVDVLAASDSRTVEKALEVVATLPPLTHCADLDALGADLPPPDDPAVAQAVQELRRRLAKSRSLAAAGAHAEALRMLDDLRPEVEATAYAPLQAEASIARGGALVSLGRYDEAASAFREALESSLALDATALAARAAAHLTSVVGYRLGRPAEGEWLGAVAVASAKATGDPRLQALAGNELGLSLYRQGRYAEAEALHREALALALDPNEPDGRAVTRARERLASALFAQARYDEAIAEQQQVIAQRESLEGPEHPDTARAKATLATTLFAQGRYREAEEQQRAALTILEAAVGERHPDALMLHSELGNALHAQGRYAEAEAEQRRLLGLRTEVLGAEHPDVGVTFSNLGLTLQGQARLPEAEAAYRAAVEVLERALGPEHEKVAMARDNLGHNLHTQLRHAEAVPEHERALEIRLVALGPQHPAVAATRDNLAYALLAMGRVEQAQMQVTQALAIWEEVHGPDHPEVAICLRGLGEILAARGEPTQARAALERALAIQRATDVPPEMRADTEFALAKVLWESGERAPARELARAARGGLVGDAGASVRREVEDWLAHRSTRDEGVTTTSTTGQP